MTRYKMIKKQLSYMLIAVMAFTGIVIPSKIKKVEAANNYSISPKSST